MKALVRPVDAEVEQRWRRDRRAPAAEEHADLLIDEPTALCRSEDDPSPYAVYLPGATEADELLGLLRGLDYPEKYRAEGLLIRSTTFGFTPRMPMYQRESCVPARLNGEHPAVYDRLVALAESVGAEAARIWPEASARQAALVSAVLPEWRMTDLFTGGIINLNNALGYHRDSGNYPGSINWMLTLRDPEVEGGHLVLPAAGVAFACGHGALAGFNAQAMSHGVTPIRLRRAGAVRVSVVLYALRQLERCLCRDAEIDHARRMRTEREERRAGLR